jgi:hypothetical protein
METIERLPIERINALHNLTYDKFKEITPKKNETDRKQYFQMFKEFIKFHKKAKGEMKRCYAYTENTPNSVGGRLFSGNSIQGLSRVIRGFLCRDIVTDIDMRNAHPCILYHICKLHNISCPKLKEYIDNRDFYMNQIPNGKDTYLKSVNPSKNFVTHISLYAY